MIHLLTGPVHSGKTTLLFEVVEVLRKQGLEMDGFLNRAVMSGGETIGYDLVPVNEEEKPVPFLRKGGEGSWQKTGPFHLVPEGLMQAERIIARFPMVDLLIVDEIGPLEMKEKGLWPAMRPVLFPPSTACILVLRERLLGELRGKLEGDVQVYDVRNGDVLVQINGAIGGGKALPHDAPTPDS